MLPQWVNVLKGAAKAVDALNRQRQLYARAMDGLQFSVAPMPHFGCEHVHLNKRAMIWLGKGLVQVEPARLVAWRDEHVDVMNRFVSKDLRNGGVKNGGGGGGGGGV